MAASQTRTRRNIAQLWPIFETRVCAIPKSHSKQFETFHEHRPTSPVQPPTYHTPNRSRTVQESRNPPKTQLDTHTHTSIQHHVQSVTEVRQDDGGRRESVQSYPPTSTLSEKTPLSPTSQTFGPPVLLGLLVGVCNASKCIYPYCTTTAPTNFVRAFFPNFSR